MPKGKSVALHSFVASTNETAMQIQLVLNKLLKQPSRYLFNDAISLQSTGVFYSAYSSAWSHTYKQHIAGWFHVLPKRFIEPDHRHSVLMTNTQ
jgi:hypothetical protein